MAFLVSSQAPFIVTSLNYGPTCIYLDSDYEHLAKVLVTISCMFVNDKECYPHNTLHGARLKRLNWYHCHANDCDLATEWGSELRCYGWGVRLDSDERLGKKTKIQLCQQWR